MSLMRWFNKKFCRRKDMDQSQIDHLRRSLAHSITSFENVASLTRAQQNTIMLHHQLKMVPDELSKNTYGYELKSKKGKYQATDFFKFKEVLGCGVTSVVFRATFLPEKRDIAVKYITNFRMFRYNVMQELSVCSLAAQSRFLLEYHSNFRVGNNLYIISELCEGGSLTRFLEHLTLPVDLCRIWMKDVCSGIFFLHANQIVHRDVNPNNVCVTKEGHLQLIDYSCCRKIKNPNGELITDMGTPAYKAPELYEDRHCTLAIDWWSVGVLLFKFCSGSEPFGDVMLKLMAGHQTVTKLDVKFPLWAFPDHHMLNLCRGFLNKKPKDRLGFANEQETIKAHPFFRDQIDWSEKAVESIKELIIRLNDDELEARRYVRLFNKLLKLSGI